MRQKPAAPLKNSDMIASMESDLDSISEEVEMGTGNGDYRRDSVQNDARSESFNDSASSSNFTWSIHSGMGSDDDYDVGEVSDGSDHEHDKLCDDNQSSGDSNDQDFFPVSEVKDSANARVQGKLLSFIDTKIELLKIEVEINQHKITAVIDSGAGNSCTRWWHCEV